MRFDRPSLLTRVGAFAGLAFMHVPVLIIFLYAFTTEDRTYTFPPPGLTLHWFQAAFAREDIWQALSLSLGVAVCATAIALVLGTLAAFALARSTTAFLAGGMLAFALSFDEVIVTIFTAGNERTLPIWFFSELFRPRDKPITNVVAVIVMAVTLVPIVLAYYFTRPDDEHETAG
jgi:ABC-type spermidine/putrescine transport system permease subunit II